LYVGKAKVLKKRVSSYFNRTPENGKTRVLVRKIADIRHIVVETEEDALLLENNLVKKFQPRYNVLLKDDKSFPWIVVTNEPFPRVHQTRQLIRNGSTYFGPYTSVVMVRTLLELFRQLYPIRTCHLALSQENIQKGRFKVCLEYHIGNCKAPCIGEEQEETYLKYIEAIKNILKGNIASVVKHMKELMLSYANDFQFEQAEQIKQKIMVLEGFQSKSTIVNPKINNVDVFSILDDENSAYINFLKVVNGAIIQAHTIEYKKKLNESPQELLTLAIGEIRDRLHSTAREIVVPFLPEIGFSNVDFVIPKVGDKKKLLDLSERNVAYYRLEKLKQQSVIKRETNEERVMKTLMKDLRLPALPVHVECFDNSNIQGAHPVAACVVFRNGKPSKKDYRHFNVKTVEGPNDFASMEEIIFRRYSRLVNDGESLPQLIVIDGGKGQLGAAIKALDALNLRQIAVIGIAKRLEEIFFPGDPVPLYLDKNSESLRMIQHLRNEAHRFGITFHRNKRSNAFVGSELDKINGIGDKTVELLLRTYKSVKGVQSASLDALSEVIGKAKAKIIYHYFHPELKELD
jgi:excinuclease ABC subunit C